MALFAKHKSWPAVKEVANKLLKKGFKAFIVGGAVRDGLLGLQPTDFDLSTDANFNELEALFPNSLEVGKSFGIFILPVGSLQIEVASFRADGEYLDGRHPQSVSYGTAREDAARRDFTVNSMFIDYATGRLIDYHKGQLDLERKIIRTVGPAKKRFNEDKLRILRAVRFATQLDFELEATTKQELVEQAPSIYVVSKERVQKELDKLLLSPYRAKGLHLLAETAVLPLVLPEFPFEKPGFAEYFLKLQLSFCKLADEKRLDLIWAHLLGAMVEYEVSYGLSWQQCLYKISGTLKELKFSKRRMQRIEKIIGSYPTFRQGLKTQNWGLLLRMLGGQWGLDLLDYSFLKMLSADEELDRLLVLLDKYLALSNASGFLPSSVVTGQNVVAAGVEQGPQIGYWLERIYDEQLAGNIKDKAAAIKWLKLRI